MKLIFRIGLAATLHAFLVQPASAQWQDKWQGSLGLAARSATHTEYDGAGNRIVRENGWLPGLALNAGYRTGRITWLGGLDWYQGDIDYQGRTQGGAAAASTTATRLASAHLGAAWDLGNDYTALAAFELDHWKRDIRGTGTSAGLQETYRSRRLVAGARKTWHPGGAAVSAEAAVVVAEPERLRVGFSGLLDPVAFDTRRGHGVRLGAGWHPAFAPRVALRARYDWLKVARSGDAPLTLNGQFAGTVAQPEHTRRGVTLTIATVF